MLSPTEPWPPDYREVYANRMRMLSAMRADPKVLAGAREYYRHRPAEFISHWMDTYDPRNATSGKSVRMPLVLFRRQREMVDFIIALLDAQANGLIEKSRDMGATYVACGVSLWLFMFMSGSSTGWGSRKAQLVDRIGDMDSIFEKLRFMMRSIPREFWPPGFSDASMPYMKLVGGAGDASVTGESGDEIGRGGRKLIYFKDESAHYERPELIEAALSENTRVQVDMSSVSGLGTVFHRKREAGIDWEPGLSATPGKTNVFVMDWRDHPSKTQEWYDLRRSEFEDNGMLHVFARETERNYAASVEGVVIPAKWVEAAIDAHKKLRVEVTGGHVAGLDVADGGMDKNALIIRRGALLDFADQWSARDTGATARRAIEHCARRSPIDIQYDCIGVGAGVKTEANRLADERVLPRGLTFVPWNAGAGVLHPKQHVIPRDKSSPLNEDFYYNLKAQAWWMLRRRFEMTYRALNEKGFTWEVDDIVSISSSIPRVVLDQLRKELSQPTAGRSAAKLKLLINKTPDGVRSPNLADAAVMAYWPVTVARTVTRTLTTVGGMY